LAVSVANSAANDDPAGASPRCDECAASLSASQRYCLECGARVGPLPAVVAKRVAALRESGRAADGAGGKGAAAPGGGAAATAAVGAGGQGDAWRFMPSPQVAAVAVMTLLAAGVILGSVTSPLAESASRAPILVEIAEAEHAAPTAEPVPEPAPAPVPVAAPSTALPTPAAPAPEAPAAPEAKPPPLELPPELEEEETLPEIGHVFLIVLREHGYEEAFGRSAPAPYLAKQLAAKGELLSNYYSVAQSGLANEVALLSGQGPTLETAANCPNYADIVPGTVSPIAEQVEGDGCVYPAETQTLPGQLAAAKLTWKAYVEGLATGGATLLGWRNPFAYFHSLLDSPEYATSDVDLEQLKPDLGKATTTPSFSYIVPDACHDGSEAPCEPGAVAGLAGAEAFLKTVVPEIEASPAYEEGGLIAITFDQAPQAGPAADTRSCCGTPAYPNLPPPAESTATGPVKDSGGGGRVGMLLLSKYVTPSTVNKTGYYNHFSLLRSIEELFGLEPLGYAAEPALSGFDSSVYDAEEEESSSAEPAPTGGTR
jgi:phosphatidylinositol-3-phosphatase